MQFVITNSMRTAFLDCPYRFFLEYVQRYTPRKEATYFKWGRLIHECEESRDNNEDVEVAIERARQEFEERSPAAKEIEEFEEMCILAPAVVDAHFLKWHGMDARFESLGGESRGGKFSLPLPSGFAFEGKIDKFIRDIQTGEKLILERKTAASTGDDYWDKKILDSQPRGYLLAAQRVFGIDARKVMYDVYKKPQIRQKKGQSREAFQQELAETYLLKRGRYFERRIITFTPEEIDSYFWDIDQVAESIKWHLLEGIWPKHHPGNRLGGCAFQPICMTGKTDKFFTRSKNYLNPELGRRQ